MTRRWVCGNALQKTGFRGGTAVRHLLILGFLGALSACAGAESERTLTDLRTNQRQPQEFSILPAKPLQVPTDLSALPTPTPGGANRTDPTPKADAIAALGGDPSRIVPAGVARADGQILAHASRFGVETDIRSNLARQDAEFRRQRSLFSFSVVPQDNYNRAYRAETLDPYAELRRLRRLGVQTPSAPPSAR